MDNPTPVPVTEVTEKQNDKNPNTTPETNTSPENVGGDQKSGTLDTKVVKENEVIAA